jgi:hypothetical protein
MLFFSSPPALIRVSGDLKMKQKIKRLLSDPAAMLTAAILLAVVVFCGAMGMWIKAAVG